MSSIEQLAKEKGGVIEALSLVGLSTAWIGAFTAHPALFKQHLREHKRNSARVIHPDQGQTDLSNQAGIIYSAFDLLNETDDDTLTKAMRQFVDYFSTPRASVLDSISSLKANGTDLQRQLEDEKNSLKREVKSRTQSIRLLIDTLSSAFDPHTNKKHTMLRLTSLAEKWFYSPLVYVPLDSSNAELRKESFFEESFHSEKTNDLNGSMKHPETEPVDPDEVTDDRDGIMAYLKIAYVRSDGGFHAKSLSGHFAKDKSKEEAKKDMLADAKKYISTYQDQAIPGKGAAKAEGTVLGFIEYNFANVPANVEDDLANLGGNSSSEKAVTYEDFVKDMQHLKLSGILQAGTSKHVEELRNQGELEKNANLLGIVVLKDKDVENDKIKYEIFYVAGVLK